MSKKTEQRSLLQMDSSNSEYNFKLKMGQTKILLFFLALLQLKKPKKYFYSCQLTQKMTSQFDRNSTLFFFCVLHSEGKCNQNTKNVEFLSNHDVIFRVNSQKENYF